MGLSPIYGEILFSMVPDIRHKEGGGGSGGRDVTWPMGKKISNQTNPFKPQAVIRKYVETCKPWFGRGKPQKQWWISGSTDSQQFG